MLYMVGTVIGAASGRFARSSLGRRESYAGSGLIFLIGAFGCSVAPNMGVLLFFRAIEGIGGGLLMSQSMTLVNDLYIGKLRTRILATITTTWSIAAVIGPLMGGLWGTLGSWRGAFATTSLLAMFFVIAAWRIVPQNKEAEKQELPFLRLSLLGISILFVGFASQLENFLSQMALILTGISCLWLTIRMDRVKKSLFPDRVLSLFSPIGTAYWVFLLLSASYTPLTIFMPLVLKQLYGLDPLWIGYVLTVFSIAWTIGSVGTAGWNERWARIACASGLFLTAAGILAIALTLNISSLWHVTVFMTISGLGVGMTNVHSIAWTLAAAEKAEAQVTASAAPAMRSIGIAYGSAVAGLIANAAGFNEISNPDIIASSLFWVFLFAAIIPVMGSICVLRMYYLKPDVKVGN